MGVETLPRFILAIAIVFSFPNTSPMACALIGLGLLLTTWSCMKVYIRHESMAYDMLSVTHQEATTGTTAHQDDVYVHPCHKAWLACVGYLGPGVHRTQGQG
jgi:hypothetical protein